MDVHFNESAEKAVLSCIIRDSSCFVRVKAILEPEDFFSPFHRKVFTRICALAVQKTPIDVVSVGDGLGNSEIALLYEIEGYSPTSTVASHYANIVLAESVKRRLVVSAKGHIAALSGGEVQVEEVLTGFHHTLGELSRHLHHKSESDVLSPQEFAARSFEIITDRMENPGVRGIKTMLPTLDEATKGLKPITILTGSSGMGKTTVGLNMAVNIGIEQQIPCLYLNYEMDIEDIMTKMQGILTGIEVNNIVKGEIYAENYSLITSAIEKVERGKLFVSGHSGKTIDETINLIYKYHASDGIQVAFIDYLGEVEPDRLALEERSEYLTFGRWVQSIKSACGDMGVKAVILAQLNREADDENITSRHIGGSYKIVQKADVGLAIGYNERQQSHYLKIIKNRHGIFPVTIPLFFNKKTQKIQEA